MHTSRHGGTRGDLIFAVWLLGTLLFVLGMLIGYAVGTGVLHL